MGNFSVYHLVTLLARRRERERQTSIGFTYTASISMQVVGPVRNWNDWFFVRKTLVTFQRCNLDHWTLLITYYVPCWKVRTLPIGLILYRFPSVTASRQLSWTQLQDFYHIQVAIFWVISIHSRQQVPMTWKHT